MLGTLFTCFLFILTHAVVAQADTPPTSPAPRLTNGLWATTHEGELNGLGQPVEAALEVTERLYEAPEVADRFKTLLSIEPQPQKIFRLSLQSTVNPAVRDEYELVKKTVSYDGALREAFVNKPSIHREVEFVLLPQLAGTLEGHFPRRNQLAAGTGAFSLKPVNQNP